MIPAGGSLRAENPALVSCHEHRRSKRRRANVRYGEKPMTGTGRTATVGDKAVPGHNRSEASTAEISG